MVFMFLVALPFDDAVMSVLSSLFSSPSSDFCSEFNRISGIAIVIERQNEFSFANFWWFNGLLFRIEIKERKKKIRMKRELQFILYAGHKERFKAVPPERG